jgi:hypothetical protein
MRVLHRVATALLLGALCGCTTVFNPYKTPSQNAYRGQTTLTNAFEYAEATREVYREALRDHAVMQRSAGILIVGAAAAAAAIGLTGGSGSAIAGVGVGGASVYALNDWLYDQHRMRIYAEGQRAIGCALDAFAPIRAVDFTAVDAALGRIAPLVIRIDERLAMVRAAAPVAESEERYQQGVASVARGREALRRGGSLRTAGARLYEAVQAIQAEVNLALVANEPDISALVANVHQQILGQASAITGVAITMPPRKFSIRSELVRDLLAEIRTATLELDAHVATLEALLAGVADDLGQQLEQCLLDAEELGLAFRIYPPSLVEIDVTGGKAQATVVARGGKPPYHARWMGALPSQDVTLSPPNHDSGAAREAHIEIAAERTAKSGTHQLLVNDEGSGRATLLVRIRSSGQPGAPAVDQAASTQPAGDPRVREIQKLLIELECLPEASAEGDPNLDGIWGDRTQTAAERFSNELLSGNLIERIGAEPGTEEFYNGLLGQLRVARGNAVKCGQAPASGAPPAATPAP